jgi:hypothetical protein
MKTNLTMAEREALPNKALCVAQGDGLWTVYEVGDTLPELPVPVVTPEVSRFQFKLALAQAGLLKLVEDYVAGSSDMQLKVFWAEAPLFARNHPMVVGTGAVLGKTDAELDGLFTLAMSL